MMTMPCESDLNRNREKSYDLVVQFECRFEGEWVALVRYDTAHGFAHCDTYRDAIKTVMTTQDYNDALTFAIRDLTENWRKYRIKYQEWRKKR
ncbi:MAG: hypothetical protein HC887_08180 [Desulfobacteraceae bacterium]|nr:hypothetical protein [Desulfobacteraceae bacterium]